MTIGANSMDILRARAKEAFAVAVAMKVLRPEGVAIQMKSGLVVSGYTQLSEGNRNAASDALRAIISCFPDNEKPGSKALNNFSIVAVLVLTEAKDIQPMTLETLQEYPEVVEGAQISHARLDENSYVSIKRALPVRERN